MSNAEKTVKKEAFNQALVIKEGSDFPLSELQQMIRDLEMNSFAEYIHEEELKLIVKEGWGRIFLAFDGTQIPPILVSYQVVLFKEYGNKDSAVEKRLQPLLEERRKTDNQVMHDDVHFDEETTIYFHLIGTRKGYEGLGISSKLKQTAVNRLTPEQQGKKRKVCVRINNASSLAVNMKVLGVLPVSFKPVDLALIGSRETNFNLETVPGINPVFDSNKVKEAYQRNAVQLVDQIGQLTADKLLVPFIVGGQGDLQDKILEGRIKQVMDSGYLIRGIFKANELGLTGNSYFYAEKSRS